MRRTDYFMESDAETLRLELKTDPLLVAEQARWAGLRPGMRVADIGCGPGKTTAALAELAGCDGEVVGVDICAERLAYAREHYSRDGVSFTLGNVFHPLPELGSFDFVWCRFLFEYYRDDARELFLGLDRLVRPGGLLCLVDLDCNCLLHDGLPPRLGAAVGEILRQLQDTTGFDPFAGRRLYGLLYDHGYGEIDARVETHNLLFGAAGDTAMHNWRQKLCVAVARSGCSLGDYPGGREGFFADFEIHFQHPRRFSYSPLIVCRGRRPQG